MTRLLQGILGVFLLSAAGFVWLWFGVWEPDLIEPAQVECSADAPLLDLQKPLKVVSFNVQYMASKNYVFFYDLADGSGKDSKPSLEHVRWTLDRVAEVIKAEDADVVLLQEMNDGAVRTHYMHQAQELLQRLNGDYPCHAAADYWRIRFMPHPSFLGPVGMQLVTLSKYKIADAIRHQLPIMSKDPVTQKFYFRRAIMDVRLAVEPLGEKAAVTLADNSSQQQLQKLWPNTVSVLNTHLDAWGGGSGIMKKQIGKLQSVLQNLDNAFIPWVVGGDFNLLPPDGGLQRDIIHGAGTGSYDQETAIRPMYEAYNSIPPR